MEDGKDSKSVRPEQLVRFCHSFILYSPLSLPSLLYPRFLTPSTLEIMSRLARFALVGFRYVRKYLLS